MILHGFPLSGHSHRAELMLSLLGLPYQFHQVDLANGEQIGPAFRKLNLFGTVPVLQDGGAVVADSAAIISYLALKYDPARTWLPEDPLAAAQVQRWLSVAQGPVFNGPCKARLVKVFDSPHDYERAVTEAATLLPRLDETLAQSPFFTGSVANLADVAMYSYIAKAPEGGVDLAPYPNLLAWLRRVEALPRFLPMPNVS
ncbi:MAG: glutathione S-transferase [Rhodospirillales bacterium]|nr:glutathione S-transferase [Rhodospirillales bacterium]